MSRSEVSDGHQKRDAISANRDVIGRHQEQRSNDARASAVRLGHIVDRDFEVHNPKTIRAEHGHRGLSGCVLCVTGDEPLRSLGVRGPHCILIVPGVVDGGVQSGLERGNVSVLHARTLSGLTR